MYKLNKILNGATLERRLKVLLPAMAVLLLGYHCASETNHLFDQEIPLCDENNSNKASLRNRDFSNGFPLANFSQNATDDGFRIFGENAGDSAGASIASGDINGDGISDILVGVPEANSGVGAGYVIFGKEANQSNINVSSLSTDDGFRIQGAATGGQLGSSLASGDINGDGMDDVIIGANGGNGAGYVIFGKKEPTNIDLSTPLEPSMNGFQILGSARGDQLGSSLASDDINADGIKDILIGALGADGNRGVGYVIFGKKEPTNIDLSTPLEPTNNGFRISGAGVGDQLGGSVSMGDINADGISDVIIGTAGANGGSGAGYVIFGSASPVNIDLSMPLEPSMNGFQILGGARGDQLGSSLASGDINGDGVKDVLIGATGVDINPGLNNTNEGAGYVIFGSTSPVNINLPASSDPFDNGFRISGAAAGDQMGDAISSGDINGDNIQDALVGAIKAENNGVGYVIFGKQTGQSDVNLASLGGNGFRILGANTLEGAGSSIAFGDINADGLGDVLVGAEMSTNSRGAGYALLGACFP